MADVVELGIKVATSADVDAFDKVSSSARGMGDAVESATSKAADSASRLDAVSASAENLDDRAGRATGALGALSAGFELVGAEKYAGALQGAAMATDFASGVGQAYNLVIELESVKRVKAIATSTAHKVATTASAAATKAAAAAQYVFNAAMNANPLAKVVAVLALVAAGVVLAYKRSETFRDVVDTAAAAARTAFGKVIEVVGNIVGKVQDVISWVRDKFPDAVSGAKDRVVDGFTTMLSPITNIYNKVVDLIEKIKSIKIPKVDLNPFNGRNNQAQYDLVTPPGQTLNSVMPGGATADDVATLLRDILAAIKSLTGVTAVDPEALVRLLRRNGYLTGKA